MKNILNNLITFFKDPKFEAFWWMSANAFLTLIAVQLTNIDWVYAPFIIALLNTATKIINTKYIKK